MTYLYATKGKRFLTYIIDFWILGIVASFIGQWIEFLAGYDSSIKDTYYQLILEEYNNALMGNGSTQNIYYYFEQWFYHYLVDQLFSSGAFLVLNIIFLVIVPIFWNGETIGRRATHLYLVNKLGKKATAKNYILREIVGTFIFYAIFGVIGFIISFFMILASNRSLVDKISGTYLVINPNYVIGIERGTTVNNFNQENDYNSVEPDWNEVKDENNNINDNNDDSEDDYKII